MAAAAAAAACSDATTNRYPDAEKIDTGIDDWERRAATGEPSCTATEEGHFRRRDTSLRIFFKLDRVSFCGGAPPRFARTVRPRVGRLGTFVRLHGFARSALSEAMGRRRRAISPPRRIFDRPARESAR